MQNHRSLDTENREDIPYVVDGAHKLPMTSGDYWLPSRISAANFTLIIVHGTQNVNLVLKRLGE
jgi:hypothetical protein